VQFRRPGQLRINIDIAPLVDVIFLLVIFFAVSTTFLESSGLKLQLPESSATTEREVKEIAVFVGADGEVVFEDESLTHEELGSRLQQVLEDSDRKVVVLRADTGTPHGKVVQVIDLIKDAGAEALTVATRAKAQQ
jgi:biopolymer transport protein ExbD/biopolymer transport protein TolR